MNKRRIVMAACGVLLAVAVWAQGVVVCRACGREAKPGATACAHCSAALPKPREPEAAAPAPAVDPAAEVSKAAMAVTANSLRQARELERREPAVALSYYQNALAVMRLVTSGTLPAGVGEAILGGNERTMQSLQRGQVPCRTCKGSGKYQLDMGKIDRKKGVKAAEGVACPACKGAGCFAGVREVAKVKMDILQGRQEFERRQMLAGDVRVGRALLPAALDKQLTNRQRALVMTGIPLPCKMCQFSARQSCTACKGSCWAKCANPDCENGILLEKNTSGVRKSTRLNEEAEKKCPRCEGTAEVRCEPCEGTGSIACKKCDGSGLAPRCSRCTGTGLMACSKCKGTGESKGGPCPECKGETVSLCTICRGEGAMVR